METCELGALRPRSDFGRSVPACNLERACEGLEGHDRFDVVGHSLRHARVRGVAPLDWASNVP